MAHGRQRYRCNACRRNFTATPPRGKPPAMKALAVLLYALGNVSQGMIAKLLGVSHVAVYEWVRAAGEGTPAPSATPWGHRRICSKLSAKAGPPRALPRARAARRLTVAGWTPNRRATSAALLRPSSSIARASAR